MILKVWKPHSSWFQRCPTMDHWGLVQKCSCGLPGDDDDDDGDNGDDDDSEYHNYDINQGYFDPWSMND